MSAFSTDHPECLQQPRIFTTCRHRANSALLGRDSTPSITNVVCVINSELISAPDILDQRSFNIRALHDLCATLKNICARGCTQQQDQVERERFVWATCQFCGRRFGTYYQEGFYDRRKPMFLLERTPTNY